MNIINVIQPYWYLDMWVFDDPRVGLSAEPFVGGADTMIDQVTSHVPDAKSGFIMVFSGNPFPIINTALNGDERKTQGTSTTPWNSAQRVGLCPALLRYFDERPSEIYVQVKPKIASS